METLDPSAYVLRFLEYLVLMVLFGAPLLRCYGRGLQGLANAPVGWPSMAILQLAAVVAIALAGVDVVLKTAGIMGMSVAEVDGESLVWYLLETSAGRAAVARCVLLAILVLVFGRWRSLRSNTGFAGPLATALAGGALATLAWNGHAAAGEGLWGAVRLGAGILHLLAAGGWIAAVMVFLSMVLRDRNAWGSDRMRSTHDLLHAFSGLGMVLVGALVISGVAHYGDLAGWSLAALSESSWGRGLSLKLLLFGGMLILAALHRWLLVPRLALALASGDPAREMRALRRSVGAEAALAVAILIVVSVLGTLSPE